jgi:hypothetical protein
MPTIPRRLPFYDAPTSLRIPGGPAVAIKDHQIIVWVSVTPASDPQGGAAPMRLPPVVDLGFNGYFLMREDHVRHWARIDLEEINYPLVGTKQIQGEGVPMFDADLWVYPNLPCFRDQCSDQPPLRLVLEPGIAVCPMHMTRYRLPLIGLAALCKNRLRLLVNGQKKRVSLRTSLLGEIGAMA